MNKNLSWLYPTEGNLVFGMYEKTVHISSFIVHGWILCSSHGEFKALGFQQSSKLQHSDTLDEMFWDESSTPVSFHSPISHEYCRLSGDYTNARKSGLRIIKEEKVFCFLCNGLHYPPPVYFGRQSSTCLTERKKTKRW